MRVSRMAVPLTLAALAVLAGGAQAKKFRYASGPKAPEDTLLSAANPYLQPIVRARGPRVPWTNLQLTAYLADSAVAAAVGRAPLDSGTHVVVAPAHDHPLNFLLEHAMLRALSRRGVEVTVRRSPIPDDSLKSLFGSPGDPVLEYTLGSAKVSYLRLVGWLPGRVQIERQSIVTGSLGMRDPGSARVLWTSDFGENLIDQFPRGQITLVEEERFPDLKSEPPQRNVDKALEPIVVVGVVAGLIALFFQNRP